MSSLATEQYDSLEVDANVDINHIDDEEVLRKLWQVTEDFAEKRRIRARMYKLREKRLKEFYTSEDVVGGEARSESPFMMMEASEVSCSSSISRHSYTSATVQGMTADGDSDYRDEQAEEDQAADHQGQRKPVAEHKRRHDLQDDAVSEKIRRKSSERSERYQKILHQIENTTQYGQETGSCSGGAQVTTVDPPETKTSDQMTQLINEAVNDALITPAAAMGIADECTSFIEELQKKVSRRERFEGEYKIITETTETMRRVRTSEQENPVTQKVTVTKTIKQHVDGTIVEEDQDEIIEDVDNPVDEKYVEEKAFECGSGNKDLSGTRTDRETMATKHNGSSSFTMTGSSSFEITELDVDSQIVVDRDTVDYSVLTPEAMASPRVELHRNHSVEIEDVSSQIIPAEEEKPTVKSADVVDAKKSTTGSVSKTSRVTSKSSVTSTATRTSSTRDEKKSQIPKISTPKARKTEKSNTSPLKVSPVKTKTEQPSAEEPIDESVDEFLKLERELEMASNTEEKSPKSVKTEVRASLKTVTKSTTSPLPVKQSTAAPSSSSTVKKSSSEKVVAKKSETPAKSAIPRSSPVKKEATRTPSFGKTRGEANNNNDDKPWRANSKAKPVETTKIPRTLTKEPARKVSPPVNQETPRKKSVDTPKEDEAPAIEPEEEREEPEVEIFSINGREPEDFEDRDNRPRHEEEEEDAEIVDVDKDRFQSIGGTRFSPSKELPPASYEEQHPESRPPEREKLNLSLRDSKSPTKEADMTRAKLTASPALDSPSVVMKARSLFDSPEKSPSKAPEPKPEAKTTTSKIRSVFESPSKNTELPKTKGTPTKVAEEKPVGKLRNPFEKTRASPVKEPVNELPRPLVEADLPREQPPVSKSSTAPASSSPTSIDDNEDLVMLENMLNSATSYDERSRIRAQIRNVKKKLGLLSGNSPGSATSSPMPSRKAVPSTDQAEPSKPVKEEPRAAVAVEQPPEEHVEKQERKVSFSQTTLMMTSTTESTYEEEEVQAPETSSVPWRRPSVEREPSPEKPNPWRKSPEKETDTTPATPTTPSSKPKPLVTQMSQSKLNFPRLPEYDSSQPDMADTLDITSSYGTGPMDENGKPLFGLGALRRKKAPSPREETNGENEFTPAERAQSPTDVNGRTMFGIKAVTTSPQPEREAPIIESRSQPLNELQKLHEQQIQAKESPMAQVEKPKAKYRDSFTTPSKTDAVDEEDSPQSTDREPIIVERSQALRDIIRRHEKVTTEAAVTNSEPLASPKPKAKLKDSFILPESGIPVDDSREERRIERCENFQNIVKRHQDLSTEAEPVRHSPVTSPIKRPGILKKPKDWSSPSPQELPSPMKESPKKPEDEVPQRKNSVEIKLEPVSFQREGSPVKTTFQREPSPVKTTFQREGSPVKTTFQREPSPVKTTFQREPSPVKTTFQRESSPVKTEVTETSRKSSVTLFTTSTSSISSENDVPHQKNIPDIPYKLTGETTGHTVRATSTFQLQLSTSPVPTETRKSSLKNDREPIPAEVKTSSRPWERKQEPQEVPGQPGRPWERKPSKPDEVPTRPWERKPEPQDVPAQPGRPWDRKPEPKEIPAQSGRPWERKPSKPEEVPSEPGRPWDRKQGPEEVPRNPGRPWERKESKPEEVRSEQPSTVRSTSTVQLQISGTSVLKPAEVPSQDPADPTPWRRRSIPREPSLPRDEPVPQQVARDTREQSPASFSTDQGVKATTPVFRSSTPRTEPSPDRTLRPSAVGSSVKALAQRFQSPGSNGSTPKQSSQYPKAGLIFRSSSFRQNDTSSRGTGNFVQRSESLRTGPRQRPSVEVRRSQDRDSRETSPSYVQSVSMEVAIGTPVATREVEESPMRYTSTERKTSYQSSTTWARDTREPSPGKVATVTLELTPVSSEQSLNTSTASKSFLEDRSPVKGMQDIIQRMRAGETNGHSNNNDDDHARSLLNKFLGAQILVQCTEPLVRSRTPDLVERVVTSTEHRGEDGSIIGRSTTATQKGSRHEVSSVVDDQGRPWTTTTSSTAIAQKTVSTRVIGDDGETGALVINGVDIATCNDETKLRELLENCNDFDTRRKIRARIKDLVEPKIQLESSRFSRTYGSPSASRNEETTFSRSSFRSSSFRSSEPNSAFAKFQQLERNNAAKANV